MHITNPITDMVLFTVTVTPRPVGVDHWICTGKETGVISHGRTEEEAVTRNGELHQILIRHLKEEGLARLHEFMEQRGIAFEIARLETDGHAIANTEGRLIVPNIYAGVTPGHPYSIADVAASKATAHELVRRWNAFEEGGAVAEFVSGWDGFIPDDGGGRWCVGCSAPSYDPHSDDCSWVALAALVDGAGVRE